MTKKTTHSAATKQEGELQQPHTNKPRPTNLLIQTLKAKMAARRIKPRKFAAQTRLKTSTVRDWLNASEPYIHYEDACTIKDWISGVIKSRATNILIRRVKAYLKRHNITREQFAYQIGVPIDTVNTWFQKSIPSMNYEHALLTEQLLEKKPKPVLKQKPIFKPIPASQEDQHFDPRERQRNDSETVTNVLIQKLEEVLKTRGVTPQQFMEETGLQKETIYKRRKTAKPYIHYEDGIIIEEWIRGILQYKKANPNSQRATDILLNKVKAEIKDRRINVTKFSEQAGLNYANLYRWFNIENIDINYEDGMLIEQWLQKRPQSIPIADEDKNFDPRNVERKDAENVTCILAQKVKKLFKTRRITEPQFMMETGVDGIEAHFFLSAIKRRSISYENGITVEKWIRGTLPDKKDDPNHQRATDILLEKVKVEMQACNIELPELTLQTQVDQKILQIVLFKSGKDIDYEDGLLLEQWLGKSYKMAA